MRQGMRVFLRFFLSYLLIMLLPFGITLRAYTDEAQRASDDIYARDMLLLEQGQRTMDIIVSSMNDMMQSLSSNVAIKSLMTYSNIYEDRKLLTNFISARDALAEFNLFSYVDAFFVYSYRSDTLVNGSCILYDAAAGGLGFLLPASVDADELNRISGMLLTTRYNYQFLSPLKMKALGNTQIAYSYVPYVTTVTNSARRDAMNIILLLRTDSLFRQLGFVRETGWLYCSIQTADGLTLLESGTPYEYDGEFTGESGYVRGMVDGQSALISYVTDASSGLRYISASSMAQIDALVAESRKNIIAMLMLTGALGLLLAVLTAMRTTAPLRRMIMGLNSGARGDGSPAVEYSDLDKALQQIMNENVTLKTEMSVQVPLLRGALVSRWLHGEYASIDEIFEAYARAGFELNLRMYAVVIAAIPARRISDTGNADRALVKALLRENVPELIDIADMDLDSFTFVTGTDLRDKAAWQRVMNERLMMVHDVLMSKAQLELTFFAAVAGDANRVHVSYVELKRLSENDAGHAGGMRWLTADSAEGEGIYFPVELELRIVDAIKNGDESELSGAFARLYTENAIKHSLAGDELRQLGAVLDAMFIRLGCDRLDAVPDTADESAAERMLNQAQRRLLSLCGQTRAEHLSRQEELRLAIEKYVRRNFADSQLSLTSAADELGYTQAYISRVFKQQTGELFSAYVERLRMERAQELLRQGELPVYKIAEACGYNSVQVFRRAFAKVYGTSPTSYAESARAEGQN